MDGGVVLIIERDDEVRDFFTQRVLNLPGVKVLSASNQKQGVEQALLENPDLILLGSSSSNSRELEFLTILKQSTCNSPVVLLTNVDASEDILNAFRQGISDYIVLPTNVKNARDVINGVITDSNERNKREKLNQRLIMVEAVRITMTTLSHYMNNYLTALDGNLTLLQESMQAYSHSSSQVEIVQNSRTNLACIKMVMQVLLNTTSVSFTQYDNSIPMIDIQNALTRELSRIEDAVDKDSGMDYQ